MQIFSQAKGKKAIGFLQTPTQIEDNTCLSLLFFGSKTQASEFLILSRSINAERQNIDRTLLSDTATPIKATTLEELSRNQL